MVVVGRASGDKEQAVALRSNAQQEAEAPGSGDMDGEVDEQGV